MVLMPYTFNQYFDGNGDPASGCLIYAYEVTTTTFKPTYTTAAGTTPNAEPVVGDSEGRTKVFGSGFYDFVIRDSLGNLLDTIDNVSIDGSGGGVISSKLELADGYLDASTALASPDSVATYSRVTVVPTSGLTYYYLSGLEDGRFIYLQNLSSSLNAVIDMANTTQYVLPPEAMVMLMYDSGTDVTTIESAVYLNTDQSINGVKTFVDEIRLISDLTNRGFSINSDANGMLIVNQNLAGGEGVDLTLDTTTGDLIFKNSGNEIARVDLVSLEMKNGAQIKTKVGDTTRAPLIIPHGSAPSSPIDGDVWTTTSGLYVRINGGTVGPLS